MAEHVIPCLLGQKHTCVQRVVSLLPIDHLRRQIDALIDAIVAYHHWHYHQVTILLLQTRVYF